MFHDLSAAQVDFDLPAPVAVCGILLAAALTKEGHSAWAIGAILLLYVLTAAIRLLKRSTQLQAQSVNLQ